jgi:uncharacterized protein (TIGR02001 family)
MEMKMNKLFKPLAVSALAAVSGLAGTAQAEVSANIGATSNYIWRGVSQTSDQAAIQGGVDYNHDKGFYLGTWTSNVDFGDGNTGYELDLYGGYGGEFGGVVYDVGYLYYLYPAQTSGEAADFSEIYGTLGYGPVSTGLYYTVTQQGDGDAGSFYIPLAFDWTFENLPKVGSIDLSVYGGYYDYEEDVGIDYLHWGVGVSKDADKWGTFRIAYDQVKEVEDPDDLLRPTVNVSWTKDFDLM